LRCKCLARKLKSAIWPPWNSAFLLAILKTGWSSNKSGKGIQDGFIVSNMVETMDANPVNIIISLVKWKFRTVTKILYPTGY